MTGWFVIFCSLAAVNGQLFQRCGPLGWRLAWPVRWLRALFEGPWARLCGLRPLGWARPGSGQLILLIQHHNRVHKIGMWVLPPLLALTVCAGLAGFCELPLHRLPLPANAESASDFTAELSAFWQAQGRTGLVFLLASLLVLPLCCLELPSALLLLAGWVGLGALLEALGELGLRWRTFSDGWFASWLYRADAEAWLTGLLSHAATCQAVAALFLVLALRQRRRPTPTAPRTRSKRRG